MRQIIDFNTDWKFSFGYLGDFRRDFEYGVEKYPFAKVGEDAPPLYLNFDDSAWDDINLPHDWTVGLTPVNTDHGSVAYTHGFRPFGVEFPQYCIGWYRKKFFADEKFRDKKIFFEFDGAFRNMQLFVNGIYVARNESGYIGDRYDITDMLHDGQDNIITARLDASMAEGWFYEGCGIYRPVRLIITDSLHIIDRETFVYSELNDTLDNAGVTIETSVCNDSEETKFCRVSAVISNGEKYIASAEKDIEVNSFSDKPLSFRLNIENPELWSPDEPNLYRMIITVSDNNQAADTYELNTGIRKIVFDADKGLFVNGRFTKVKGVCCHQDHAGVGSAISESLYEYRITLLKEMGANAYRCSHNPPSPALLDVCDRLGMLVMDENRLLSSGPESMSQCERLIRRDRNHPCIFIWSMANEEGAVQAKETARKMGITLKRLINSLDHTRPVTYAPNNGACETGITSVCDVRGWNYMAIGGIDAMDKTHEMYPERPILGTEEASTVSTRGVWETDEKAGFVSDYGEDVPGWGSTPEQWWSEFAVRPYLLGSFVWTGFDYRGEPTPFRWPNVSSHFGIMDMCGFPKARYYYYKANWTDEDVLHICPDWNINVPEGTKIRVKIYTNCESVTLYLNEKGIGHCKVEKYKSASFETEYHKGILKAVGIRNGKEITEKLETADKASVYEVTSRSVTAGGEKTTVFTVEAKDEKGRFNAQCDDELKFTASDGVILGVGNGNPSDHECDIHKDRCRLFRGLLSVIVSSAPDEIPELKVNGLI